MSQITDEGMAELRRIAKQLKTQDSDHTRDPIFCVEVERRIVGIDTDYDPPITWLGDGMEEVGAAEASELEAEYEKTDVVPDGYTRTGYAVHRALVQPFLTREAAEEYLARHGHKHDGPLRLNIESAQRNTELQTIQRYLPALVKMAQRYEVMKQALQQITDPDNFPAYHPEGLGCGLEDRSITDRYEAMRYGWDQLEERVADQILSLADQALIAVGERSTTPETKEHP